jgi:hypothetical protein
MSNNNKSTLRILELTEELHNCTDFYLRMKIEIELTELARKTEFKPFFPYPIK